MPDVDALRTLLEAKSAQYNRPNFIAHDPISIPHRFTKLQDIEIAGFWAAVLAWGNRVSIIRSCERLLAWMDHSPYQFICQHTAQDLKPFLAFKHRTFNATDTLYFIHFFRQFYQNHASLEEAFLPDGFNSHQPDVREALVGFHQVFFNLPEAPQRTRKHVATPLRQSACKRLNMFLRWMVRQDKQGVDFGLWKAIRPAQLVCPCDVHVSRVARKLGLISRKNDNWLTAIELTENLRLFDPSDPVKYDFALFGLGLEGF